MRPITSSSLTPEERARRLAAFVAAVEQCSLDDMFRRFPAPVRSFRRRRQATAQRTRNRERRCARARRGSARRSVVRTGPDDDGGSGEGDGPASGGAGAER